MKKSWCILKKYIKFAFKDVDNRGLSTLFFEKKVLLNIIFSSQTWRSETSGR